MTKRHIREMVGKNVQRQLASYQGEQDAQLTCDWLRDCATKGYIPYTLCDESKEVPNGSWGPEVSVGIPGRTGKFYVMQDSVDDTDVNFWKLPDDIQEIAQVITQSDKSVTVKVEEEGKSNYLLQKLLQQGVFIHSFNEILPSLNEIFIKKIESVGMTSDE